MNWKQINEAYPKAFLEWVNKSDWFEEFEVVKLEFRPYGIVRGISADNDSIFSEYKPLEYHILRLLTYFDTLGVIIESEYEISDKVFRCKVINKRARSWSYLDEHPDRLSALEAGIIKAFEIREQQLKTT